MNRALRLLVLLALLAIPALNAGSLQAADSTIACTSSPLAGPPGTVFSIACTGFSANRIVNAYVVEPDGRAISAAMISGFHSNLGSSSILTDKTGAAMLTWQSAGGGAAGFSVTLGSWTWVVQELDPGATVAARGQVTVAITSQVGTLSGAELAVSPSAGAAFNFTGVGFVPIEYVNVWVSMPPNCSGRLDLEGASAAEPSVNGLYYGFDGPSTVKADKDGNIVFSIVFRPEACRGFYSVTARALGSGRGGVVSLEVTASGPATNGSLVATPDSVNSIAPFLTLLGSGFSPDTSVNCWTTRPDGRAFGVGTTKVDSSGNYSLSIHASGFDSFWPFASEEPGVWYATCGAPNASATAVTTFVVTSLTADP